MSEGRALAVPAGGAPHGVSISHGSHASSSLLLCVHLWLPKLRHRDVASVSSCSRLFRQAVINNLAACTLQSHRHVRGVVTTYMALERMTLHPRAYAVENVVDLLGRLRTLKVLTIFAPPPSYRVDLRALARLPALAVLHLHACHLNEGCCLHTLTDPKSRQAPWRPPAGLRALALHCCRIDAPSILSILVRPEEVHPKHDSPATASHTLREMAGSGASSCCRQLQDLELSGLQYDWLRRDTLAMYSGLSRLTELTRLVIKSCYGLKADAVEEIAQLPKLQVVNISQHIAESLLLRPSFSDESLLCLGSLQHLTSLTLNGSFGVAMALSQLFRTSCSGLVRLDIRQTAPWLSVDREMDSTVQQQVAWRALTSALQYLPHLKAVALGGSGVRDSCLKPLCGLPLLTSLQLSGCSHLTDSGLYMLTTLSKLKELRLCQCCRVTDIGVAKLLKGRRHLRRVELSYLDNVTALGIRELQRQSLKELNLSGNQKLTDQVFSPLIASCCGIQILTLQECVALTDASLAAIGQHLQGLHSLNVQYCDGITASGMHSLKTLPDLQYINVYGTSAACEDVHKEFPGCEVVVEKAHWWTQSGIV